METYLRAAVERAMKVQEVIMRAMARKINWVQAGEILGMCERQMRRWKQRYQEAGYAGPSSLAEATLMWFGKAAPVNRTDAHNDKNTPRIARLSSPVLTNWNAVRNPEGQVIRPSPKRRGRGPCRNCLSDGKSFRKLLKATRVVADQDR